MAEHIERESILKRFSSYIEDFGYGDRQNKKLSQISVEDAMMIIEDEPAADVRPERYGEWVHLGGDEWGCSYCGFVISTESSREHPISETQCNDYCRKCGTKMNGKDSEDND